MNTKDNTNIGLDIMEYFNRCLNIRKTAIKFNMVLEDLYEFIFEYDGTRGLQCADDYHECRKEIIGRREWFEEQHKKLDEMIEMKRTPDREDMHEIIEKYNSGNSELYEIADEYNLWINNLFRLLKENGIIVVETDAKGYDNFYAQHMGAWSKRNGSLNLIEDFYVSV